MIDSSVFLYGSDDEVREHLEFVFGTDVFQLAGDEIVLELPLARAGTSSESARAVRSRERVAHAMGLIAKELESGDWVSSNEIHTRLEGQMSDGMFGRAKKELGVVHRRVTDAKGKGYYEWQLPVDARGVTGLASTESTRISFHAPSEWSVQAPGVGQLWHVLPEEADATLCGIELALWTTPSQRDDDHPINCPWCRAMIIAIGIAAPPPQPRTPAAGEPTLHVEIERILREHNAGWMTTTQIADEVNAAGRYRKRDGSPVTAFQIHGRTRNYPHLFERDGSRVRLRQSA